MKSYPTIPREIRQGMSIYAFGKIDGSNIRAEWSRKAGFYKFGSRHRLLGTDQDQIPEAEEMIKTVWAEPLTDVFRRNGWERAIAFFEFWGNNSFAGLHDDELHRLSLIDVNPYKKGILPPKEFLDFFGHLDIAPLLYHGPCDAEFIESVRQSTLEGMPLEGVVCKAKNPKNTPMPVMFKIKSDAWLQKLKDFCKGDERMFERLM